MRTLPLSCLIAVLAVGCTPSPGPASAEQDAGDDGADDSGDSGDANASACARFFDATYGKLAGEA